MANKNKKHGYKKFLVGGMLALSVFSTSFLATNFQNLNKGVYASYMHEQSLISNKDFSSYSTSSTPYSPNNWTYENPQNNNSIKAGVINVSDTAFSNNKESYKLSDNPGTPFGDATDNDDPLYKHLMINSPDGRSRAGYTSSSFTLSSNSYYGIDVFVKTVGNAQAGIYINGLSDEKAEANITGIVNNNWDTYYTIFIETNDFVSENATLGLWLGGQSEDKIAEGAVLFNKVKITQYSKSAFNSTVKNANSKTSKVVSLKNNYYIDNAISNPSFNLTSGDQSAITGWTVIESNHDEAKQEYKIIDTNSYNADVDTQVGIANPLTNNMIDDTRVLYINNLSDGKFGLESSSFTLPQSEFYRLTVWTKSGCGVGSGATLKVVEQNPDSTNTSFTATTASKSCPTSVSTDSPATNNWTMNTFFLEGHPLKDTEVKLQIWLGETENTTGYVFVDNITLEKVNYKVYENASNAGATKYSYNEKNTGYTIVNGNFNVTQKENVELSYPLTPSNWALTSNENVNTEQTTSGIINTNDEKFAMLKNQFKAYGLTISNPGLLPSQIISGASTANTSNNVLLIGNSVETTQSYLSESFSLGSGSIYKLSYYVNTQFADKLNSEENYGVNVTIKNSSYTLFNENNIKTNSNWEQKVIYFKNGTTDNSCTIELGLNNIQGYAFFDNVQLETVTEENFALIPSNSVVVDLSKETFNLYDQNSNKALNTLFNWKGTNNKEGSLVKFGALDTTKNVSSEISVANPGATNGNKNVLMILGLDETYYTAKSDSAYSLNVDQYYKISVNIKTVGLKQTNNLYDEKNKVIPFGATIALSGFDNKFTGINTQNDTNPNNDYVTYTFYLAPNGSTTTSLELSLGSENSFVSGYAFFDNVTFAQIEESEYLAAQTNAENNNKIIVLNNVNPDDTTENNNGSNFSGSEFNWIIIPSLLTGLAVVIALVGSMIRQFKFTKKPKIKTSYDRRKTVEVDMDKRERIELRNQIIAELNNEYAEIDNEIAKLNQQLVIDKENLRLAQEQKRAEHNKVKQAILIEKENAIKEYNAKLETLTDVEEKDKLKFEKQFNTFIQKLDKRAEKEDIAAQKVDNAFEKLTREHEIKVKRLTDKQLFIKQEIERIEREIEAISKQEEIMWNEYRRAKEEAKKEKLEYLTQKRKEKQNKKAKNSNSETAPQSELEKAEKASETTEQQTSNETTEENKEQTEVVAENEAAKEKTEENKD